MYDGLTTKGTPRKRSPNGARVEKVCVECGTAFSVRPSEDWVVRCSRACADRTTRGRKPGFTITEEHREKLRQAKLGIRGPDHWNWRGGAGRTERQIAMARDEYKQWRIAVFKRDGFACQECGATGVYLNADHIKAWSTHPELRYDISNGRTLCVPCHRATPTWGGRVHRIIGYTKRGRPVLEIAGGSDNKTIDNGALTDFTTATDEIAGVDYQYVKLADGTDGSTAKIGGDATNGLDVDVTRIAAGAKIQLTDGTSDATVRNLPANDALNVALVDGSGNHITSLGGTGGTAAADDADWTQLTTPGTPIMGVYESTPTSVTDNDMGTVGMNINRAMRVEVAASTVDVAHDAADSGNPVLVGQRGLSALPTAVTTADRTRAISDLWGRQLTSHIDPGMQTYKSFNATTTQTSIAVWTPGGGKKIAVTSLEIGTYGTTAGRLILYFSEGAYVEGTSQPLFKASFAPSSTVKPGALIAYPTPVFCTTADMDLRITTDAALSVDIVLYGYEF